MSGLGDEVSNISRHFSSALLRNPSVVRNALRECGGADGTYKLLDLVEYLLKFPSVKESLEEITCHGDLVCISSDHRLYILYSDKVVFMLDFSCYIIINKNPRCKKVRGQSEAALEKRQV